MTPHATRSGRYRMPEASGKTRIASEVLWPSRYHMPSASIRLPEPRRPSRASLAIYVEYVRTLRHFAPLFGDVFLLSRRFLLFSFNLLVLSRLWLYIPHVFTLRRHEIPPRASPTLIAACYACSDLYILVSDPSPSPSTPHSFIVSIEYPSIAAHRAVHRRVPWCYIDLSATGSLARCDPGRVHRVSTF